MKYFKLISLIFFTLFYLSSCKKDCPTNNCEDLKNALESNNNENLKSIVTNYINSLPSQQYTQQNINTLASSFSKGCSISSKVLCFDCIMTLPSETEIQLTVTSNQLIISKVIDISYTADNKMKFVSAHE